jgi:hypothetical protein
MSTVSYALEAEIAREPRHGCGKRGRRRPVSDPRLHKMNNRTILCHRMTCIRDIYDWHCRRAKGAWGEGGGMGAGRRTGSWENKPRLSTPASAEY